MATSRNILCAICEAQHITCSMLSITVDVLDVLIISRIDKSPTQSLWFVEIQSGQQGLSWN
jgi:hypothetical protein